MSHRALINPEKCPGMTSVLLSEHKAILSVELVLSETIRHWLVMGWQQTQIHFSVILFSTWLWQLQFRQKTLRITATSCCSYAQTSPVEFRGMLVPGKTVDLNSLWLVSINTRSQTNLSYNKWILAPVWISHWFFSRCLCVKSWCDLA